ncbi:hypothetical protein FO519_007104 [Halicephalobus sp. NKZ332]|nr:hypothetical protein FO519_007104 [Halicephalobus sp. NKZ332]
MRLWILFLFFVSFISGCQGIDPTWIWDLIKLVKDVSKIAESLNEIKGVSLTNDIYFDLQKVRKATERGIPDLKWTILQQRYDQEIEIPAAIVFRSANEFLKRPNKYNRHRLELACQKYWPSFVLQHLYMMLDDRGRSWYLEQLEILHFSSKQADFLEDQVMNSVEELVLSHAFCISFHDLFDKYTVEQTIVFASNISSILKEQKKKAGKLYYPKHLELFAEEFIDNFDSRSCSRKSECNKKLSSELQAALKEEFNYEQLFTVRVSQKEPHFTGRIPKETVTEIRSNGFHVLIYKTDFVLEPPKINPDIQDALDSHDSFFFIQNRLCNWNPFNPVGTLRKIFPVIEPYCGNTTFCAITKYDHDAQITKTNSTASKCFYFLCFPFFKGITVIQGIPAKNQEERRMVFSEEGSLWDDVLRTVVKLWQQRWETSKRSKRQLENQGIFTDNLEATEVATELLHDLENNTCSLSSQRTAEAIELKALDQVSYFIPPVISSQACNIITLGVGEDIEAELKIKDNYPQCTFLGVDLNDEISRDLFKVVLGGKFVNTAIGAIAGNFTKFVIDSNTGEYHKKTLYRSSFQELLDKYNKNKPIDMLFIDIDGEEFQLLEYIVDNVEKLPKICQINVELHFPEQHPPRGHEILRTFSKMTKTERFLPLYANQFGPFYRIFIINIGDIICRHTYLGY